MTEATLEAPTTEGDVVEVTLNATHRCDKRLCGAQAFIRAVMPGGGDLLFCGHHGRENADALAKSAVKVFDYTGTINDKPSASANAE